MGSKKGAPHRYHSQEYKMRVVREVMEGKSPREAGETHNVGEGLVRTWVRQYQDGGESALEPKRKPGNPLAKYIHRKELSEVERLQYELAKARVEIAKLKKVYELERRCGSQKK